MVSKCLTRIVLLATIFYGEVSCSEVAGYLYHGDTDCEGTDLDSKWADGPGDCAGDCNADSQCFGFVYCTFFGAGCFHDCFYKRSDCNIKGKKNRKFYIKRINGGWTSWSGWSACSVTCGGGTRSRSRPCTNPAPQYGGQDCTGSVSDTDTCNTENCPINGGWTIWSDWSACSVTCQDGVRTRSRSCMNPEPQYGGNNCGGDNIENIECSEPYCPGVRLQNRFRRLNESNTSVSHKRRIDRMRCAALCSATQFCVSFHVDSDGKCIIKEW